LDNKDVKYILIPSVTKHNPVGYSKMWGMRN